MSNQGYWASHIEEYLVFRRRLGFALTMDAYRLRQFAAFADASGHNHLTIALAAQWARSACRQTPLTWARRIEVLRGFAHYCQRFDNETEIPPRDLFGPAHRRLIPHIFTSEEIFLLLEATQQLLPLDGLRPATCRSVFGLLASCGLRISEAVNLKKHEVDLDTGILQISETKFHKCRWVPMHPTVTAALEGYAHRRDQMVSKPVSDHFFLLDNGKPANQSGMLYALHCLCRSQGWQTRGDYPQHRLHDLRHTFIVNRVLRFYAEGIELDRAVLALSTYVGHAKVSDTYWYFTGIPELMAIAAERFHLFSREARS
jgi:site-specific recombinase XerD